MSIFCRVVANDNMNYETNFVDFLYSGLRIGLFAGPDRGLGFELRRS